MGNGYKSPHESLQNTHTLLCMMCSYELDWSNSDTRHYRPRCASKLHNNPSVHETLTEINFMVLVKYKLTCSSIYTVQIQYEATSSFNRLDAHTSTMTKQQHSRLNLQHRSTKPSATLRSLRYRQPSHKVLKSHVLWAHTRHVRNFLLPTPVFWY
jgi:hypothetical protein